MGKLNRVSKLDKFYASSMNRCNKTLRTSRRFCFVQFIRIRNAADISRCDNEEAKQNWKTRHVTLQLLRKAASTRLFANSKIYRRREGRPRNPSMRNCDATITRSPALERYSEFD